MNRAFRDVATWLNDFENHRTDTQYEDNLVTKLFVFQLFNSYSYLSYLAFVKPFLVTRCVDNDCYQEITDTLLVLFVFPFFVTAMREVVLRKVRPHFVSTAGDLHVTHCLHGYVCVLFGSSDSPTSLLGRPLGWSRAPPWAWWRSSTS